MALYFGESYEWHVGDPLPKGLPRVVQFQADGDELNVILTALKATVNERPIVDVQKAE